MLVVVHALIRKCVLYPPGVPRGINTDWGHMKNGDVISMPDKWEFPWVSSGPLITRKNAIIEMCASIFLEQKLLFLFILK